MTDRELWDNAAEHWNDRQGMNGAENRAVINDIILNLINDKEGQVILDAGCGTGPFTRFLYQKLKKNRIISLDFSFKELSIASKYKTVNKESYIAGDLCGLPFQSNSFDKVIANFVLSDLPCLKTAVSEIARVTVPSGKAIFSLVHPVSMLRIIERERRKAYLSELQVHKAISVENYFDHESNLYYWSENVMTRVYHRTIQDYFSAMIESGFCVTTLLEPNVVTPNDESGNTTNLYPRFLILSGYKMS